MGFREFREERQSLKLIFSKYGRKKLERFNTGEIRLSTREIATRLRYSLRKLPEYNLIKIETKVIKDTSENDIAIGAYYEPYLDMEKEKCICIQIHIFSADGLYRTNLSGLSTLTHALYDSIEHEFRHLYQWRKSNFGIIKDSERAWKKYDKINYYDRHTEVDAYSINAISEVKYAMHKFGYSKEEAIKHSFNKYSIIQVYHDAKMINEVSQKMYNKLLKKVYKGLSK